MDETSVAAISATGALESGSYLARACQLVTEHAELFEPRQRTWAAVAAARAVSRPVVRRSRPNRRQLALPLRLTMQR